MKSSLLLARMEINFKMIRKVIQGDKKKFVLIHPYLNAHDQWVQCLDLWALLVPKNLFLRLLLILSRSLYNKKMTKRDNWVTMTEKMMMTVRNICFSEDKSIKSLKKDHHKEETLTISIHKESPKEISTTMKRSMEASKDITDQIWRMLNNKNLSNKSIIDLGFCLLFWFVLIKLFTISISINMHIF